LVDDVGAFRQFIADCFIARPFGRQISSGAVDEAEAFRDVFALLVG
jgi:hypothetical protein